MSTRRLRPIVPGWSVPCADVGPRRRLWPGCMAGGLQGRRRDDVLGLDGDYVDRAALARRPRDEFRAVDLLDPPELDRTFDLGGEPRGAPSTFPTARRRVRRLAGLGRARRAVLGGHSRAGRRQPRQRAMARRTGRERFEAAGYRRDRHRAPRFWNDERVEFFFAQNIVVYARVDVAADVEARVGPVLDDRPAVCSLVHPRMLDAVREPGRSPAIAPGVDQQPGAGAAGRRAGGPSELAVAGHTTQRGSFGEHVVPLLGDDVDGVVIEAVSAGGGRQHVGVVVVGDHLAIPAAQRSDIVRSARARRRVRDRGSRRCLRPVWRRRARPSSPLRSARPASSRRLGSAAPPRRRPRSRSRVAHRAGEDHAARRDASGPRLEFSAARSVADDQQLRRARVRRRRRWPDRHPSRARAHRSTGSSAPPGRARTTGRAAARRRDRSGGKRSGGTPFGMTRILWRPTPNVSCSVSADPDQRATTRLAARSATWTRSRRSGRRGPERRLADLAIDERRSGRRPHQRAQREAWSSRGRRRRSRAATGGAQRVDRRRVLPRRTEHVEVEAADGAGRERDRPHVATASTSASWRSVAKTCAPRRSVSVTTCRIGDAMVVSAVPRLRRARPGAPDDACVPDRTTR